jgi:hypothetical protein
MRVGLVCPLTARPDPSIVAAGARFHGKAIRPWPILLSINDSATFCYSQITECPLILSMQCSTIPLGFAIVRSAIVSPKMLPVFLGVKSFLF